MRKIKFVLLALLLSSFFSCSTKPTYTDVAWRGEIKQFSDDGKMEDNAMLSELTNGKHLYAVGSLSQMDGEITVIDGVCYISQVTDEQKVKVSEDCSKKSPFLVYGYYSNWREIPLKKHFKTLKDLSRSMTELLIENGYITEDPSGIMIQADVEDLDYQLSVKKSLKKSKLKKSNVTMVGFYSKNHGGVFTDKGQNLHLHFISNDNQISGHVNDFFIAEGSKIKLYFPLQR